MKFLFFPGVSWSFWGSQPRVFEFGSWSIWRVTSRWFKISRPGPSHPVRAISSSSLVAFWKCTRTFLCRDQQSWPSSEYRAGEPVIFSSSVPLVSLTVALTLIQILPGRPFYVLSKCKLTAAWTAFHNELSITEGITSEHLHTKSLACSMCILWA